MKYELFSILIHEGGASNYFCYIYENNFWCKFNDKTVTRA